MALGNASNSRVNGSGYVDGSGSAEGSGSVEGIIWVGQDV